MPIYEYECNGCGAKHEFIQKFSEGPKRKCPDCGKSRLRKLVSAAAFHLKGDGWYVTDFRDKKKKESDDKSESASSETTASDSASDKSESKSDSTKTTASDSKSETKSKSAGKSKSTNGAGGKSAASK